MFVLAPPAQTGPPFQTDDPEPVPWHHYEAYVFTTVNREGGLSSWHLPASEFNVGAAPNLQLHMTIPGAFVNIRAAYAIGDAELGAKYHFVEESRNRPQIGAFPMLELPTGNSRLGLRNGQIWARLPVWVQKSHGPWTTYGGVGYEINHALGMKDSLFAGWLLQRQITRRLTLGTEVYHQGVQSIGARQTTFVDSGGYFNVRANLSLLFMLGHTVTGERHMVSYFGLYDTLEHRA